MTITSGYPATSFKNHYVFASQMVTFKKYRTVFHKKTKVFGFEGWKPLTINAFTEQR